MRKISTPRPPSDAIESLQFNFAKDMKIILIKEGVSNVRTSLFWILPSKSVIKELISLKIVINMTQFKIDAVSVKMIGIYPSKEPIRNA